MIRKYYAEVVEEIGDALALADQQAHVDPEEAGYPAAEELTNEQLVGEWACLFDEKLEILDPKSNPNGQATLA